MTVLLTQIFICLVLAALIGAVAAWLLRRVVALRREDNIQQHWRERVRQIEIERDRSAGKLSAEISALQTKASQSGENTALVDYENLVSKLADQVAEREDVIAELRSEIHSLRSELTESLGSARKRESALLQQHELETANLMAQLEQPATGDRENSLRQKHEHEVTRLTTQLELAQRQASENEDSLRQENAQEMAALNAQFRKQQDEAGGEQVDALRNEHEQEIVRLNARFEQQKAQALDERENALRQKHQQELSHLRSQLEQKENQAPTDREEALRQRYEQQVARLEAEIEKQGNEGDHDPDARIAELKAEIQLRDDSIGVLRDDLAELSEYRRIDQRGRQDEQLRAVMDESLTWQKKYQAAADELTALKQARPEKALLTESPQFQQVTLKSSSRKRERASGDRIGSVLSHPGGPKDRLQEIKGIGPVLERRLNDIGIYHFKQIAEFNADDIVRLSNELGRFAGRISRDEWVRQAKTLHSKYHD